MTGKANGKGVDGEVSGVEVGSIKDCMSKEAAPVEKGMSRAEQPRSDTAHDGAASRRPTAAQDRLVGVNGLTPAAVCIL